MGYRHKTQGKGYSSKLEGGLEVQRFIVSVC